MQKNIRLPHSLIPDYGGGCRNFREVTCDGRIVQGLFKSLQPDEVSNLCADLKAATGAGLVFGSQPPTF